MPGKPAATRLPGLHGRGRRIRSRPPRFGEQNDPTRLPGQPLRTRIDPSGRQLGALNLKTRATSLEDCATSLEFCATSLKTRAAILEFCATSLGFCALSLEFRAKILEDCATILENIDPRDPTLGPSGFQHFSSVTDIASHFESPKASASSRRSARARSTMRRNCFSSSSTRLASSGSIIQHIWIAWRTD